MSRSVLQAQLLSITLTANTAPRTASPACQPILPHALLAAQVYIFLTHFVVQVVKTATTGTL